MLAIVSLALLIRTTQLMIDVTLILFSCLTWVTEEVNEAEASSRHFGMKRVVGLI